MNCRYVSTNSRLYHLSLIQFMISGCTHMHTCYSLRGSPNEVANQELSSAITHRSDEEVEEGEHRERRQDP